MVYLQRWHSWCHMKLLPSRRFGGGGEGGGGVGEEGGGVGEEGRRGGSLIWA